MMMTSFTEAKKIMYCLPRCVRTAFFALAAGENQGKPN